MSVSVRANRHLIKADRYRQNIGPQRKMNLSRTRTVWMYPQVWRRKHERVDKHPEIMRNRKTKDNSGASRFNREKQARWECKGVTSSQSREKRSPCDYEKQEDIRKSGKRVGKRRNLIDTRKTARRNILAERKTRRARSPLGIINDVQIVRMQAPAT